MDENFIKEAIEDTVKFRALVFHFWMQKNYPGRDEIKTFQLYDHFEMLYNEMNEKNQKERPY